MIYFMIALMSIRANEWFVEKYGAKLYKSEQKEAKKKRGIIMEHKMVSTTFDLPGYRVVEGLGMVRGITVRSRNVFSNVGAQFRSLAGGKIGAFVKLCEEAREEAYSDLVAHAESLGANAIIGFRYDANDIMDGITEVLAYGTAVRVEKNT